MLDPGTLNKCKETWIRKMIVVIKMCDEENCIKEIGNSDDNKSSESENNTKPNNIITMSRGHPNGLNE